MALKNHWKSFIWYFNIKSHSCVCGNVCYSIISNKKYYEVNHSLFTVYFLNQIKHYDKNRKFLNPQFKLLMYKVHVLIKSYIFHTVFLNQLITTTHHSFTRVYTSFLLKPISFLVNTEPRSVLKSRWCRRIILPYEIMLVSYNPSSETRCSTPLPFSKNQ